MGIRHVGEFKFMSLTPRLTQTNYYISMEGLDRIINHASNIELQRRIRFRVY